MLSLLSIAKLLAEAEDILEVIDYLSLPFFHSVHFYILVPVEVCKYFYNL